MPYRSRQNTAEFVYHVFNRAIQSLVLFDAALDYDAFVGILAAAVRRYPVRLLAYAVMPNHWHMIVWPEKDDALSAFMQWLTETHARRWREWRGTRGRGAVYQGRFKAVPIQRDAHFLVACRYVERNPLRSSLVTAADEWPWSSASDLPVTVERPLTTAWPVARPSNWHEWVNAPEPTDVLEEIRTAIREGRAFGDAAWRDAARERLSWLRGRPRGGPDRAAASQEVTVS